MFVHELKCLLDHAMPKADATTRKKLLIHQFLTGIPVEVSKQLRAIGDMADLDKLIQRAKLIMTLDCDEKTAAVGLKQQTDAVEALQLKITALTEQVAALTTQRRNPWRQPVSSASSVIILDTCKEIVPIDCDDVIRAEDQDISPVSATREMETGRPSRALGAPENCKPFV